MAQHRVLGAAQAVVQQNVFGELAHAQADAVVAAVVDTAQHAGGFQLLQHAVQGGFGQAGFVDQALQ
jgi:hypothetical protein